MTQSINGIFAAIDIGTNSIRLAVVKTEDGQRLTTLAQHREAVRLGEGEFETGELTPEAIRRGVLVVAKFVEVARGFGADEIVAFATSAVREADNREEFIQRVRDEAGIEVRVISGIEEARLIWTGVSSGFDLGDKKAILIDIGGGSTEVIIGNAQEHLMLDSLKLGCIRLSNHFFSSPEPVEWEDFKKVQGYIVGVASGIRRRIESLGFDMAVGSAGTINALGAICTKRQIEAGLPSTGRQNSFLIEELREALQMLCRLPLEGRREVPGLDANRADLILGGGAVILTLMEMFGIERLTVSDRGLRDGILLDHLLKEEGAKEEFAASSVRRRSILQLARACRFEEEHARHTTHLCFRLYDELHRLGEHVYGSLARELLEYAAITHDIGTFLSHSNHQKHAYYLVRNSDLLGFNESEIDIIANVALYHRKGIPKKKHLNLENLNRADRRLVTVLAAILRIAEGMDRGHLALVKDLRLEKLENPPRFELTLLSDADCTLEMWGVLNNRDLFEFAFEAPLTVRTTK